MKRTKKISVNELLLGVHCSTSGGVASAPVNGARLGCGSIQLFTGNNQKWFSKDITDEEAEEFLNAMKAGGIKIAFSHTTYLINLASPEMENLTNSINSMIGELKRAAKLEIPFVVLHPGSHKETGLENGIKRISESINKIIDKTRGLETKIALENTAGAGSSIGSSFTEIARIIDGVDNRERVVTCYDTCHGFAAGYDIRDKALYKKMWTEFDKTIGSKKLAAIHLNDSKGELASHVDRHEDIGRGKIGLAGFANIMNDPSLRHLPMVIETPKGEKADKNDLRNLRTLRKLIAL